MTMITFITQSGACHRVEASTGMTLLDAAKKEGLGLLGTCGGSRICGTCHLIVKPDDFMRVGAPNADEMEILEWVSGLTDTSRLGCQIKVNPDLDGLEVTLP